jgi:hypothetical protein
MSAAVELPPETALVVAGQPVTALTLFSPGGVETLLTKLEREVRGIKRDISTPKGRAEIKSLAHKVARSKTALDEMGKGLNEAKRAEINKVDAERRVIRERCDALKEEVLSELSAWEAKETARVKGHEDALKAMSDLFALLPDEPNAKEIKASLDLLDRHEDSRDWAEFAQRAHDLHAEVGFKLTEALKAALAREAALAEAQRQREEAARIMAEAAERARREREARIAAEAAERARVEAERRAAEAAAAERQRVEQERLDAEDARREAELAAQAEIEALEEANRIAAARAEAQRLAAERAVREAEARARQAEADRIEAEERARREAARLARESEIKRKAAEAKAEADAAAAVRAERQRAALVAAEQKREADAKAADRENRARVHREMVADLTEFAGLTADQSRRVVEAIARKTIRNINISY